MKPLPTEFHFDNSHFRQLAREGDIVLLERTQLRHRCSHYKVIVVQRHPARTIHGREYLERESMPSSAEWGALGWSYAKLSRAQAKFDELVMNRARPGLPPTPFLTNEPQGMVRVSALAPCLNAPSEKG